MKTVAYLFSLLVFLSSIELKAEETRLLEYSGTTIESPYWFKDSFLELADDIEEANDEGKRLILYFHQAGCPYCYNLVQQSLLDPVLGQYIQDNFDLIALNLWGDREVTLPDGTVLTEKELAIEWKVQYTPTLFFYTDSDEPFLRIDGYRSKEMLAKILDYVVSGNAATSLAQSLINKDITGELYPSVSFQSGDDLSGLEKDKPIAILFEYPGCEDCNQLHKQVLSRSDTFKNIERYQAYRFDISKEKEITLPSGEKLTAQEWTNKLGLNYFPSMVLFDGQAKEQFRVDGYVQAFHFNTALEYVSDKVYQRLPEFQRFINERADRLRDQGQKIVITQ